MSEYDTEQGITFGIMKLDEATFTVIPPSKKTYYGSKKIPKLSKRYLRQMKEN